MSQSSGARSSPCCVGVRRFDDDFAKQGDVTDARWFFQHATVWPDLIRGHREYDQPTWHYVNFPLLIGGEGLLLGMSRSTDYPPLEPQDKWNIAQAEGELQRISLPEGYLEEAGRRAWQQVVSAGSGLGR